MYIDFWHDVVLQFVEKYLYPFMSTISTHPVKSYKTLVQEALMKHNTRNAMYHTKQLGPNSFEAILKVGNITYGKGVGQNKKIAEKAAAKEAYSKLVKEGR